MDQTARPYTCKTSGPAGRGSLLFPGPHLTAPQASKFLGEGRCAPQRRLGSVFVYSTHADSYRHGHGPLLAEFAAAAALDIDRCQTLG